MFYLPFVAKNSYISWLHLPRILGAFFSELFEMLSSGLEVLGMYAGGNISLNF